jgi:hypothetical protein
MIGMSVGTLKALEENTIMEVARVKQGAVMRCRQSTYRIKAMWNSLRNHYSTYLKVEDSYDDQCGTVVLLREYN